MTKILQRWSLARRLALLALLGVLMVAPPLAIFVKETESDIAFAQRERDGLAPAKLLVRVIQLTQQHRGLSAQVLGGNAAMQGERAAKQAEVEKAAADFSAALARAGGGAALQTGWVRVRDDWKALARDVAGAAIHGRDSNARHTALVALQLELLEGLADDFNLSYDPAADGYHLIIATLFQLPKLTESLGQARARGSLILTSREITPEERGALTALVRYTNIQVAELSRSFGKAIEAGPELKESVGSGSLQAKELAEKAMRLTREQILEVETLSYPGVDYFRHYTQAMDALFKLFDDASVALDHILARRIAGMRWSQAAMLGASAILMVLSMLTGVAVLRSIQRQLGGEPAYAAEVVSKVAAGDLTLSVETKAGDRTSLLAAMKGMLESLARTVRTIKDSSDAIATASQQIASGNADLSSRTEEQASSLEETASSMEELTSTVKQNAENARQANQLAAGAAQTAQKGGQMVAEVVATMEGISASSKRIADIIGVIDGIAFQTNILALNAAVEAARAGEQGRGFAVVAGEVRGLAQKSAAAAKEIKALIEDSVGKVEQGVGVVERTGETIGELVGAVRRVADLMGEITAASEEQSSGIAQVNQAVAQMDEATQQNAALVEEAAAASESLREQAEQMRSVLGIFRLQGLQAEAPAAQASAVASGGGRPVKKVVRLERRGARPAAALAAANEAPKEPPKAKKAAGAEDEWQEF